MRVTKTIHSQRMDIIWITFILTAIAVCYTDGTSCVNEDNVQSDLLLYNGSCSRIVLPCNGTSFPIVGDCSGFYVCTEYRISKLCCSQGTAFDYAANGCISEYRADCACPQEEQTSTPVPDSSGSSDKPKSNSVPIEIVIVVIVLLLVVIVTIVVLLIFCIRKRQREKNRQENEVPDKRDMDNPVYNSDGIDPLPDIVGSEKPQRPQSDVYISIEDTKMDPANSNEESKTKDIDNEEHIPNEKDNTDVNVYDNKVS